MVLKEYKCINPECGHEFEGLADICPLCASDAKRAFRTPVGISTNKGRPMSKAKTTDRIIEREFQRQGIANFTNKGGENKVTWKSRVTQKFPGTYLSNRGDLPHQQFPVTASIARPGDFGRLQNEYGAVPGTFNQGGQPYTMPQGPDNSFEGLEPQAPVKVGRHRPDELMRKTEVIRHPEGDPSFSQAEINSVLEHS